MKKIFLSGPITGKINNNEGAFNDAAKVLREMGHVVLSPPELTRLTNCTLFDHIDFCRLTAGYLINEADVCVMLDGWQTSKGCAIEKAAAELFKIPVVTIDEFIKQQEDENRGN